MVEAIQIGAGAQWLQKGEYCVQSTHAYKACQHCRSGAWCPRKFWPLLLRLHGINLQDWSTSSKIILITSVIWLASWLFKLYYYIRSTDRHRCDFCKYSIVITTIISSYIWWLLSSCENHLKWMKSVSCLLLTFPCLNLYTSKTECYISRTIIVQPSAPQSASTHGSIKPRSLEKAIHNGYISERSLWKIIAMKLASIVWIWWLKKRYSISFLLKRFMNTRHKTWYNNNFVALKVYTCTCLIFIYFKPEFLSTCTALAVQVVPIPTALEYSSVAIVGFTSFT